MKKIYTKPTMAMENFTLTERIAACDDAKAFNTADTCQVNADMDDLFDMWRFLLGEDKAFWPGYECEEVIVQGPSYGDGTKLCYHTSLGTQVFAS